MVKTEADFSRVNAAEGPCQKANTVRSLSVLMVVGQKRVREVTNPRDTSKGKKTIKNLVKDKGRKGKIITPKHIAWEGRTFFSLKCGWG